MASITARPGSESKARADLIRIYAAAVAAVAPARVITDAFEGKLPQASTVPALLAASDRVRLLAVGKAALGMAHEASTRLETKLGETLVIVPSPLADADAARYPRLRILAGAHPLPDASSEIACRAALDFVAEAQPGELVLFALSGGASALMAAPAPGVTLADKVAITAGLLRSAASIRELNTVRKHLSAIKGGRLLRALAPGVRMLNLVLSDVPGNDLGTIGSGPAAADATTYADAVAVRKLRGLWGRAPEAVRDHLERGAAGEIEETVKRGDPELDHVTSIIVGDNAAAVRSASQAANALGYQVEPAHELSGEANDLGRALASRMAANAGERVCVIAGGEPVVTVKGSGKGGRAQQCALAMALELARLNCERRVLALFAGTDGVDGPTDAAGAIATPSTLARAQEAGADAHAALLRNDCYNLFKGLGDLIITGPTGTNVADIFIGLINY
jgi:glycerate 2-kinase